MATFNFGEANGTTLEVLDSKWAGDSTQMEVQSGVLQPTTSAGGNRTCWYENGHGNAQSAEMVIKARANGLAPSAGPAIHVTAENDRYTDGYWVGYTNGATTTVELRENGVYRADYLTPDITSNDVTLKIEDDGSGNITVTINGTPQTPFNDTASPLTGGYPGFNVNPDPAFAGGASTSLAAIDNWTDGVAGASGPTGAQLSRMMLGIG
jgi:hypothetical protein